MDNVMQFRGTYLWRHAQTYKCWTMAPWLPLGVWIKSLDPLSDTLLLQRVLGSSCYTSMPVARVCRELLDNEGINTWPTANKTPLGYYVSVHPALWTCPSDCPGFPPSRRTIICCFVQGRIGVPLDPDEMTSNSHACFWPNMLHEGCLRLTSGACAYSQAALAFHWQRQNWEICHWWFSSQMMVPQSFQTQSF